MTKPTQNSTDDATDWVLSALLAEALALTEEVASTPLSAGQPRDPSSTAGSNDDALGDAMFRERAADAVTNDVALDLLDALSVSPRRAAPRSKAPAGADLADTDRSAAQRLRLTARLARIAVWASVRAAGDGAQSAFAEAALYGALPDPELDPAPVNAPSELKRLRGCVDRLTERAARLDGLLDGVDVLDGLAGAATPSRGDGAVILPFPTREAQRAPAIGGDADDTDATSGR